MRFKDKVKTSFKRFFSNRLNIFLFGVLVGIWIVCGIISVNAAENTVSYPTPQSGIDYIYIAFEDPQSGDKTWVQATVTNQPDLSGYVVTCPSGYDMVNSRGVGVWLYTDDLTAKTFDIRYYCTFFNSLPENPFFYNFGILADGESDPSFYKLSLGYFNNASDLLIIDSSFYQVLYTLPELDDNIEHGNIFCPVYWESYSGANYFYFDFVSGNTSLDISQTISALTPSAGNYNYNGGEIENIFQEPTGFLNNLTDFLEDNDPMQYLSISGALAAVYNPVIDRALVNFLNGTDKITFSLMVLVVIVLVSSILFTWLRRG